MSITLNFLHNDEERKIDKKIQVCMVVPLIPFLHDCAPLPYPGRIGPLFAGLLLHSDRALCPVMCM